MFLWMFFCGESVEQTAKQGLCGHSGEDFIRTAELFAARWRHGMAGNAVLYMPGFYAVGVVTWLWSMGRNVRRILVEEAVLIAIATTLGAWLAPWGAPAAIHAFERAAGVKAASMAGGFTPASAAEAIYTLITWSAGMVCGRIAVSRRSLRPLGLPVVMNVILLIVRPWAVNGYTSQWVQDLSLAMPEAVLSLIAAPVLLACLIGVQLRRENILASTQHN
jgi:hypothetical protein